MGVLRQVYDCLNISQWRFFGGRCLFCGHASDAGAPICRQCERSLPQLGEHCWLCLAPLTAGAASQTCGRCLNAPPTYDRVMSAFRYARPIDGLIIDLKYHGRLHLARTLGARLATRAAEADRPMGLAAPACLIPVPLHPTRLRERGYNQSMELARPIARALDLPICPALLARTRNTEPQALLPEKERASNVRGAFSAHEAVKGMAVALVDDVLTSGQTAHAAAKALKQAGAKSVEVWVVARAGGD